MVEVEAAGSVPSRSRLPLGWLVALGVLVVAFVVSAVVLILVVKPPSYEPVPIPSVSST